MQDYHRNTETMEYSAVHTDSSLYCSVPLLYSFQTWIDILSVH